MQTMEQQLVHKLATPAPQTQLPSHNLFSQPKSSVSSASMPPLPSSALQCSPMAAGGLYLDQAIRTPPDGLQIPARGINHVYNFADYFAASKKTLNVDSPSFTPATLPVPGKSSSITSQAANAAPFTPRGLASGKLQAHSVETYLICHRYRNSKSPTRLHSRAL